MVTAYLTFLALASTPALAAATCSINGGNNGKNHYYAGSYSSQVNQAGIEGFVSVDPESLNGAVFAINWLGIAGRPGCQTAHFSGACSMQAGYGTGNVGSFFSGSTTVPSAYMEENDVNGYDVNWLPPGRLGLTQDDFTTTFYTGTNNGSTGLWDSYIQPNGSSPVLVGQAYFPDSTGAAYTGRSQVSTETAYASSGTCAAINQFEYYGTDGSGSVNVNTQLKIYRNSQWIGYENASPIELDDGPYFYYELNSFVGFRVWGS